MENTEPIGRATKNKRTFKRELTCERSNSILFFFCGNLLCLITKDVRTMLWRRRRCCSVLCLALRVSVSCCYQQPAPCCVCVGEEEASWITPSCILKVSRSSSPPFQPVPTCFIVCVKVQKEKIDPVDIYFQHGRFLGIFLFLPSPVCWSFFYYYYYFREFQLIFI